MCIRDRAEWTRFFPLYRELKTKLVKDGELGEPRVMFATFGVKGLNDVDRIKMKELGGSVILDIGKSFYNISRFLPFFAKVSAK